MSYLSKIVVQGQTIQKDSGASAQSGVDMDYRIQIGSSITLTEYVNLVPNGTGPLIKSNNFHSFIVKLPIGITIKSSQNVQVCFFDEYPVLGSQYVDGKYSLSSERKVTHEYAFVFGYASLTNVTLQIGNNIYEDIYRLNFLKGKKILCFGDSNTYQTSADTTDGSHGKTYPQLIAEYADCTTYDTGIGGTRFAKRMEFGSEEIASQAEAFARLDFISLVEALISQDFTEQDKASAYLNRYSDKLANLKAVNLTDIDIVTVYYGWNDWASKQTIGELHSTVSTETYGAINLALQAMLAINPKLKFYFISPYPTYKVNTDTGVYYWSSDIRLNGITLEDLVEKIKTIAAFYGAPVLDLYHTSGINPYNIEYYCRSKYEVHATMGYAMIAKKIIKFINSN